jgi:hypothetical protein
MTRSRDVLSSWAVLTHNFDTRDREIEPDSHVKENDRDRDMMVLDTPKKRDLSLPEMAKSITSTLSTPYICIVGALQRMTVCVPDRYALHA